MNELAAAQLAETYHKAVNQVLAQFESNPQVFKANTDMRFGEEISWLWYNLVEELKKEAAPAALLLLVFKFSAKL